MRKNIFQSFSFGAGTVFNSVLGLFFYLLVARDLGPTNFGHFSFLLGIGMMASELADWGFGSAIVRFGSKGNLESVLGVAIVQRVISICLITLIGILATVLLKDTYLLSVLVAGSLSFLVLTTQALLAKQKYVFYVGTNIFGNSIRLILTIIFIYIGLLNTTNVLLIFSGANFAAFVISCRFRVSFNNFKSTLKEILGYSNWLGSSFALSSVAAKIDVPFVFAFSGATSAGIYSSAQKLASVFPQVASAIEGVFSPKFSEKTNIKSDFRDYLIISSLGACCLIFLIPFSSWLVPLFFGVKYVASIGTFNLFLVGLAILFIQGPFSAAVLYRFGKSQILFASSAVQLLVSLFLYYILVHSFGANGAALTFVVMQAIGLIMYFIYWLRLQNGKS